MPDDDVNPEDLKDLPPAERIQKLKELAIAKKKALEDAQKELEEELEEAEELIEESEEELDEQREEDKQEVQDALEHIAQQATKEQLKAADADPEYGTKPIGEGAPQLYDTLQEAANELERLYDKQVWTTTDEQLYKQSKQEVEKAQGYSLTNEVLEEELGLASSILNRLKYKGT